MTESRQFLTNWALPSMSSDVQISLATRSKSIDSLPTSLTTQPRRMPPPTDEAYNHMPASEAFGNGVNLKAMVRAPVTVLQLRAVLSDPEDWRCKAREEL